jgi:hypothetical protein
MAIAFDATSNQINTGSLSITHTPVGTPKGVFFFVIVNNDTATPTSVTYGGVAMTLINSAADSSGEIGSCFGYFLGSSIPTGAQTVAATVTAGKDVAGVVITVTAAGNTQLAGTGSGKVEGDTANPSVTITGITGASYGAAGLFSGLGAVGNVAAGSGQTTRGQVDFGNQVASAESSTSENASGNLTIAFTSVTDDVAMVAIAIEELVNSAHLLSLLGTGN